MKFEEPLIERRPWLAALLLGTVATPAAVILAIPAPWPVDAVLAWPLVLLDRRVGPGPNIGALVAGIVLTWLFYVLLARLMLWRVFSDRSSR